MPDKDKKVVIYVLDGDVVEVKGLPEGYKYEVVEEEEKED